MKKENNPTAPVLFIVFNRLDTTKQVFEEIRKAKPKQLFIAADGPRNKEEKKKTDAVRKYISDNIDWKCKVEKIFREKNVGCDKNSLDALDYFFKNVEYGIFLEDDVLPSQDFFRFHSELLEKYKNNDRIKAILGVNFLGEYNTKYNYIFSRISFSSWGFSTWGKKWRIERKRIKNAIDKGKRVSPYFIHNIILKKKVKDVLEKGFEGYDYLFAANNYLDNSLTVVPKKNLAKSIGFTEDSSHKISKTDRKFLEVERMKMDFPLKHSTNIKPNKKFDRRIVFWSMKKILEKKLKNFLKIK